MSATKTPPLPPLPPPTGTGGGGGARSGARENASSSRAREPGRRDDGAASAANTPTTVATKKGGPKAGSSVSGARPQYDDPSAVAKMKKARIAKREDASRTVLFLSHLPQFERSLESRSLAYTHHSLHRAVVQLGLQYADGVVSGSSARALALVDVFRCVVQDFEMTAQSETQDFRRELDKLLRLSIQFVADCRIMSVAMGNFVRYLKAAVSGLPATLSVSACRTEVLARIDRFRVEKLELPVKDITESGAQRVVEQGDVVLVYGRSMAVAQILRRAAGLRRKFKVVVIDSRPWFEGKHLAKELSAAGVSVEYGLITGASYLLDGVTKVLLGAHSFTSNGAAMARVGSAALAALAQEQRIPVIFACELAKFSDRVQLDAISFNELGDPDDLIVRSATRKGGAGQKKGRDSLDAWREVQSLRLLNLMYDLTPLENINAVVTEAGVIPPSSVSVMVHDHLA